MRTGREDIPMCVQVVTSMQVKHPRPLCGRVAPMRGIGLCCVCVSVGVCVCMCVCMHVLCACIGMAFSPTINVETSLEGPCGEALQMEMCVCVCVCVCVYYMCVHGVCVCVCMNSLHTCVF